MYLIRDLSQYAMNLLMYNVHIYPPLLTYSNTFWDYDAETNWAYMAVEEDAAHSEGDEIPITLPFCRVGNSNAVTVHTVITLNDGLYECLSLVLLKAVLECLKQQISDWSIFSEETTL